MKIQGKRVILVPMKPGEKGEFYKLATESFGSKFWYDDRGKTKKEFFADWKDDYFDLEKPDKGQCFWIEVDRKRIGQVNYNKIDKRNKRVELDIIIGPEEYLGKGYGPDALRALAKYLFENFELNKICIEAREDNPRAVGAYEKAGFKKEGLLREQDFFEGKFVDCVRFGMLRSEFDKG